MMVEQIEYMVNRFLSWRLPKDFDPDGGISYKRLNYAPEVDATPTGTNLFNAEQAEQMIRYIISGMPRRHNSIALPAKLTPLYGVVDANDNLITDNISPAAAVQLVQSLNMMDEIYQTYGDL